MKLNCLSMKKAKVYRMSCFSLFACCLLFVIASCSKEITQVTKVDLAAGSYSFNGVNLLLNKADFIVGDSLMITATSQDDAAKGYAFAFIDQECIWRSNEYPCTFKKEMKEAGTFVLTIGYSESYVTSFATVDTRNCTSVNITVR